MAAPAHRVPQQPDLEDRASLPDDPVPEVLIQIGIGQKLADPILHRFHKDIDVVQEVVDFRSQIVGVVSKHWISITLSNFGMIFGQFLIESVSLSLLGGLLGTGLGFGVTLLASQAFEDGLAVSPVALALAAAFAIVIGLAAGVYPALRASRMAPVDALRAL